MMEGGIPMHEITNVWLESAGFECVMKNDTHSKWTINTELHLIDLRSGFGHWTLEIQGPNASHLTFRPTSQKQVEELCKAMGYSIGFRQCVTPSDKCPAFCNNCHNPSLQELQ
jgi:hypothetical protein